MIPYSRFSQQRKQQGFTMVELLVVIAIMVIMVTLARPAMNGMINSFQLGQAGQEITGAIVMARQEAVKRNQDVEVRFYQIPASVGNANSLSYRSVQLWSAPTGQTMKPINARHVFPTSIVIKFTEGDTANNQLTAPLLTADGLVSGTEAANAPSNPYNTQLIYHGFRIRANGQLSPVVSSISNNYLTIVRQTDKPATGKLVPPNYYMVQVNPVTCGVSTYRP